MSSLFTSTPCFQIFGADNLANVGFFSNSDSGA